MTLHERRYPAIPHAVTAARHDVERAMRLAGLDGDRVADVRLAVSEAATNVVLHAYPRAADGQFDVVVQWLEEHVEVVVTDQGSGSRSRRDSPGAGHGLSVILKLADSVDVRRSAGEGTRVRMRFAL